MTRSMRRLAIGSLWTGAVVVATVPLLAVLREATFAPDGLSALSTLQGTLEPCGGEYCVGDAVADFGPWEYLDGTEAASDHDGDGNLGTLAAELDGLVGTQVTLEVEDGPRHADVFAVNGVPWRQPTDEPPPSEGVPADEQPLPEVTSGTQLPSAPPDTGPALVTLEGTLTRCGDDYCVGETVADLGPWWYLQETRATGDPDGDGSRQTLAAELDGLVGTQVILEVEYGSGSGDARVFVVNGTRWREGPGEPPPWAGGPMRRDDPGAGEHPDPTGPSEHTGPPDDVGPPDHAGGGRPTD